MQDRTQTAIEVAETASKTTYFGAFGGAVTWLMSIDWLPLLGLLIALAGFITNVYFKRIENKRAQEIHDLKIKEMLKK